MEVYKYKGALSEAEQYFKALLANDSMNAYAYHGLGLVNLEQNDFKQAISDYTKSIDLFNTRAAIYKDIVNAYKATKNLDGAIDYLSGLAHTKLRNAGAYYGLGYAYRLLRQWENALMALDKALTLNPDLLEAHIEKTIYTSIWESYTKD
ncbi:MAG: tetratricopeptide repeat protein [bacterium]